MTDVLRTRLTDLAEEMGPVDLRDRVLIGSNRSQVRWLVSLTAMLLVVAGVGVSIALNLRPDSSPPSSPNIRPTTLPTGLVVRMQTYPTTRVFEGGPIGAADLTLPRWSDAPHCPVGTVRFRKGAAVLSTTDVEVTIVTTVTTEVDKDHLAEVVAMLECRKGTDFSYQVVAFTPATPGGGGPFSTLGRVVGSGQAGIVGIFDLAVGTTGGVLTGGVRVEVGDRAGQLVNTTVAQWRSYSWVGGTFVQTGGPTAFPANPSAVDLNVTAFSQSHTETDGRRALIVDVVVTNQGAATSAGLAVQFVMPGAFTPAGDGWKDCLRDDRTPSEGNLMIQCSLPVVGAGQRTSMTVRFLESADPIPSDSQGIVVVGQPEPATVERDFSNNQATFSLSS